MAETVDREKTGNTGIVAIVVIFVILAVLGFMLWQKQRGPDRVVVNTPAAPAAMTTTPAPTGPATAPESTSPTPNSATPDNAAPSTPDTGPATSESPQQ